MNRYLKYARRAAAMYSPDRSDHSASVHPTTKTRNGGKFGRQEPPLTVKRSRFSRPDGVFANDRSSPANQEWFWVDSSGNLDNPSDYTVGCSSSYEWGPTDGEPCSGSFILNASASSGYQPSNFPLPTSASNPNDSADYTGSNYTLWWVYPPAGTYYLFYKYAPTSGSGYGNFSYAYVGMNVSAPTSLTASETAGSVIIADNDTMQVGMDFTASADGGGNILVGSTPEFP